MSTDALGKLIGEVLFRVIQGQSSKKVRAVTATVIVQNEDRTVDTYTGRSDIKDMQRTLEISLPTSSINHAGIDPDGSNAGSSSDYQKKGNRKLVIGNKEEVEEFFTLVLRKLYNTELKFLTETWITALFPNRSVMFPYTGRGRAMVAGSERLPLCRTRSP